MAQLSSINFKPSKDFQVFHNGKIRPSYIIGGELECEPNGYTAKELKQKIISQAIENYNKNKAPKAPNFKAKNYEWSAVCNIKPETTMDDLKKLAQHFSDKYGFQCYQIAIHRDEGHINDDGEKVINHHAHLEFITLDKENGKQRWNFTPSTLRELQTEVAQILNMERGQDKRISGAKRVEPRIYAQMKEQERANQKALKNELESTKTELKNAKKEKNLSKTAIKSAIKTAKVAWRNENAKRIEQGLAPIYTAEHYNSSEYLKGLENGTYKNNDEFLKALDELQKRIFKEYEQGKNATHGISIKSNYKSRLIDENYSDLSKFLATKYDLDKFYFDRDKKELENAKQGYKIKDFGNTLQLKTSNNQSLAEQVEIMLKMAQSKGWELSEVKISGSQAFCDEVARQIAEIKAKEKAEQEKKAQEQAQKIADLENKNINLQGLTQAYKNAYENSKNGAEIDKLKAENQSQAEKLKELEKENAELRTKLESAETALKTQNEQKSSQDINQSEKTQENAPLSKQDEILKRLNERAKAESQAQEPSAFDKEPEKSQEVFKEFKELCDYVDNKYRFATPISKRDIQKRIHTLLKDDENHKLLKTYHKLHYQVKKGTLEKLAREYEQSKGISR